MIETLVDAIAVRPSRPRGVSLPSVMRSPQKKAFLDSIRPMAGFANLGVTVLFYAAVH
jgi:hypothetical protein